VSRWAELARDPAAEDKLAQGVAVDRDGHFVDEPRSAIGLVELDPVVSWVATNQKYTTVFMARESGRPPQVNSLPDEISVSVITIEELRASDDGLVADRVVACARRQERAACARARHGHPVLERHMESGLMDRFDVRRGSLGTVFLV
jgi:hypothetical protein